ncbi:hypothetical protein TSUD_170590 [Trifolium subterraneum]|uniref:Uncharacterized protein n=1 Tax=Trifolium subterraneum TaxID=3900 RepID=A0A2Z6MCG2_TRISU|nr:hypothetical protein TSUD_170590 [Trifolium subterraneum]
MQIGETGGDGVQQVDGGTKLKLWREAAVGRTRGRVYGTASLSVNLRRGCTSSTQQSCNPHGSMFVWALLMERLGEIDQCSTGGSCNGSHPPSHPDVLDEESLDEQSLDGDA